MTTASAAMGLRPRTLTIPAATNPLSTSSDPAEVGYWVRVLTPTEYRTLHSPKTGDVLEDGSVLLREDDISRMGLNKFRSWIVDRIIHERKPIVMLPSTLRPGHPNDED